MWLGMASAAALAGPRPPGRGRSTLPNSLLLAYIAQVAAWCGRPELGRGRGVALGGAGLAGAYLALAAARRARGAPRSRIAVWPRPGAGRVSAALLAEVAVARDPARRVARARRSRAGRARSSGRERRPGRCRACGSASSTSARATRSCCSRPARPPSSSTAGRPEPGSQTSCERGRRRAARRRRRHPRPVRPRRRDRRAARRASRSARLVYAPRSGASRSQPPRAAGARAAAGRRGRRAALGRAAPRGPLAAAASCWPSRCPGADPNRLALVLLARWRDFSMLLSADAEAEAVPLDPGPVDVLKVAHHGSDDAGLARAARAHPAGAGGDLGRRRTTPTATRPRRRWRRLRAHGVRTLRTDRDGTIVDRRRAAARSWRLRGRVERP